MRIDLHAHSTESDGTQAPADVVASAREAGLEPLARTLLEQPDAWEEVVFEDGATAPISFTQPVPVV